MATIKYTATSTRIQEKHGVKTGLNLDPKFNEQV